jgi:hypothetical protein
MLVRERNRVDIKSQIQSRQFLARIEFFLGIFLIPIFADTKPISSTHEDQSVDIRYPV